jgi:4-hydroxybenzoate polyprenyltransferase
MLKTIRLLGVVSRAEFLLPNLGSLIMGLAWGASPPLGIVDFVVLVALAFTIINLSSAIGAQANTISDYELDTKDDRKKHLVDAMDNFGRRRLKYLLIAEFLFCLVVVVLFMLVQGKPILLVMWLAGISLGCAYSLPPLRIKSRSWLAPVTLILVLAILPVMFAYYTFASALNPIFLIAVAGLALTVYGVIIPTEIRDYFGDKAMSIETMTVRLGLVKASLFSIILLASGGALIGIAFFLELVNSAYPFLGVFVLAIAISDSIALMKFKKLYSLSKEYEIAKDQDSVTQDIVKLSAHNPQWIMLVTQTYTFVSILLLVSRFLLI